MNKFSINVKAWHIVLALSILAIGSGILANKDLGRNLFKAQISEVDSEDIDFNKEQDDNKKGFNKSQNMIVTPRMSPLSPVTLVTPSPVTSVTPASPSLSPTLSPSIKLSTEPIARVFINEIAWAGTEASSADEWLELYNPDPYPVNISGWRLVSGDESPNILFPDGTTIPANGYFLIERTNDDTIKDLKADLVIGFGQGGLNNTGEFLRLIRAGGIVSDSAGSQDSPWFSGNAPTRLSMERLSYEMTGSQSSSWKSFSGTIQFHDANNNFIYGTPKSRNSPTPVVVTGGSNPGSSGLSPSSTVSPSPTSTVSPSPSPSPTPNLSAGSVVINEIAWMGTEASSNDEWIELYNTTTQTISLSGWSLNALDGSPAISLTGNIAPGGFYFLERTNDSTVFDVTADQIYSGALNNNGESFELMDSGGNLQDSLNLGSWPAGDNTSKSSMERVNPQQSGNNASNWTTNNGSVRNGLDSDSNPINGTPKSVNSTP